MQHPQPELIIALDVGGSSIKSALVESAAGGKYRLASQARQTFLDSSGSASDILATFTDIILTHLGECSASTCTGIALAFPGPFDYEVGQCHIKDLAKFGALYGVNITEALYSRLPVSHLPIRYRNDAEAAVVGEALYGAGQRFTRLIGLTLGTGCGSAFMADGKPQVTGPGVPPNGWLYSEPYRGARADDVFSTRGLLQRLALTGCSSGDVQRDADLARNNLPDISPRILDAFQGFGADLGTFLQNYITSFGAKAVLVLGGLATCFDLFGAALQAKLSVPALRGQLGIAAALLGAAAIFSR